LRLELLERKYGTIWMARVLGTIGAAENGKRREAPGGVVELSLLPEI
jgi:hypothetical protein